MIKKHFPIILLIIINIVIGILIVPDFGESWDEAPMHYYADLSLNAYSSIANINIDKYYADEIQRYYGPAYVMAVKLFIQLIGPVNHLAENNIWHFCNFLTFQMAILFFYLLCSRLFNRITSFVCTLLFNTQPLLWGHAFINPRDIPFMAFFLGAIVSGLYLMDVLPADKSAESPGLKWAEFKTDLRDAITKDRKNGIDLRRHEIILLTGLTALLALAAFTGVLNPCVTFLINLLYHSKSDSFLGNLFSSIALNKELTPVGSYIQKGIIYFSFLEGFVIFVVGMLLISRIFNNFKLTGNRVGKAYVQVFTFTVKNAWKDFVQKIRVKTRLYVNKPRFIFTDSRKCFGEWLLYLSKWQFWLAAFLLGVCISIRVVGVYAGLLIAVVLFIKNWRKSLFLIPVYVLIGLMFSYLTWPFLWGNPINRLFESYFVMSKFPWDSKILFDGQYLKSDHLPHNYFPLLMAIQFPETSLLLIVSGFLFMFFNFKKQKTITRESLTLLLWFLVPFLAVVLFRPPLYDNFRHFLFMIPPLFIIAGFTLQALYKKLNRVFYGLAVILALAPGIYSLISLHPYPYVYYNSLVGGIGGADTRFEMDYYGTSLKETTQYLNSIAGKNAKIVVAAPIHIVQSYARKDLVLVTTPNYNYTDKYDFLIYLNRFTWADFLSDQPEIYTCDRQGTIYSGIRKLHSE